MSRRINSRTKRNVVVKRRNTKRKVTKRRNTMRKVVKRRNTMRKVVKRRNTMRKVVKRNRNVNRKNYRNYGGKIDAERMVRRVTRSMMKRGNTDRLGSNITPGETREKFNKGKKDEYSMEAVREKNEESARRFMYEELLKEEKLINRRKNLTKDLTNELKSETPWDELDPKLKEHAEFLNFNEESWKARISKLPSSMPGTLNIIPQ